MKSIGGKIYSVLVVLSIVFALVLLQNQSSLNDIDGNNNTMSVYMKMQEAKSEASTAFQQIQLYSNLTYFKKDKPDEKDLMIEKLGTATEVMDAQLNELGMLIESLNDEEISAVYNVWRTEADTFFAFINEIRNSALEGDYDAVFERVNVQNVQKAPVQEAEDNYDEIIKAKEANINTITANKIDSANKASFIGIGFFVVVLLLAVVIVNTMIAKPAKVAGKTLGILVEKIANNEGDLTERIAVKSKDEIGQMAIGINGFMEQLQLIMQKLKAESENMMISAEKVRVELTGSSDNANSVERLMEFIDEKVMTDYDGFVDIVTQYKEDANSVNEILNAISTNTSTISGTMQSMNTGISDISIAVDENAKGIVLVAESVGDLVQELGQIKEETAESERISLQLGDEVKRFKKV